MTPRALAVLLFSLLLAGCGHGGGGAAKAADPSGSDAGKPPGSTGRATVKIDGDAQQKAGIRAAVVELRAVPQYLNAPGQIVMNEERTAHIGTYTDGRITELHADLGDPVKRGMILARMHSHDVHETRAAYESALESVARQENAVLYQGRMRDRMQRLYELKSATRQEVEKADSDLRAAQTDLANAHIAVTKEIAHLTDILHLPEDQLKNIDETTEQVPVVAPISGVVVNRLITVGSVVEPGAEVYTVSDLSSVWMMASVNEADVAKVRTGDRAKLLTQAYPDEAFTGMVTRLGTELDPKTRTLPVRITVPNPSLKLRIAMYANAQIARGFSHQAIFVPEEALQDVNGRSIVFVRQGGDTFEPRAVDIAHRLNGEAEIAGGLQPGEAIVVKGSFVVKSEMLKSQIGE